MLQLDADLDGVQTDIVDFIKDYFASREGGLAPDVDDPGGFSAEQWQEWVAMDWLSLLVPEELDGVGMGARELAILAREAGRTLAPIPFVFALLGAWFTSATGSEPIGLSLLDGTIRLTLAPESAIEERSDDGTLRVSGTAVAVPYFDGSDAVIARTDRGTVILVASAHFEVTKSKAFDGTRRFADLRVDGAPVTKIERGDGQWERLVALADLAVAADGAGVAQRSLQLAVDHARTRKQFGREIGTFQGVSHRCALMAFDLQAAWSLIWDAAQSLDEDGGGGSWGLLVGMAKARSSDAGVYAANSVLQILGGMGFAAEHDSHRLLRRAILNSQLWQSAAERRAEVAQQLISSADEE